MKAFGSLRLLVFAFAILLALTSCAESGNFQNKLQQISPKNYISSCEDYAKKLIPSVITLEGGAVPARYGRKQTWLDESEMKTCSAVEHFMPGSAQGQNVNYWYQTEYFCMQGQTGYVYNKKIIDNKGLVLGDLSFGVQFVVKPINDTVRLTDSGYTNQDFEVISYGITGCTKPEGVNLDEFIHIKCIKACVRNTVIECGTNIKCFENAEKNCQLARVNQEKDGRAVQLEVAENSGDVCTETIGVLTPGGTVYERSKMTCKFPRSLWGAETAPGDICKYCKGGSCN